MMLSILLPFNQKARDKPLKNKFIGIVLRKQRYAYFFLVHIFLFLSSFCLAETTYVDGLPLYYWQTSRFVNFGDYISLKLVERILGGNIRICQSKDPEQKFLAIGSLLPYANTDDVIWGTGMNGKKMDPSQYHFDNLDIRAVRGPMTREFIMSNFNIDCPEVYGDPALLIPYFFPEFKKNPEPEYDYIIVLHYSDAHLFPKSEYPNVVYATDPWKEVMRSILNSNFVISSSLHGIVIAEAYGIPAKYLRVTDNEPLFKYQDYYLGTGRSKFEYATSINEALEAGGEPPAECDLKQLYENFPFEYWPDANYIFPF
jgi:pyruvyltransferase